MNEIVIGLFDPERLPELVPLFEAQFREHQINTSADTILATLRTLTGNAAHGFLLTARAADEVVGVAYVACILSLEHGGWSCWLEELYVLPEWRGRGAGSRLLEAVMKEVAQRGWHAVDLEVDASHERAIGLYARHDFAPVNRKRFVRRFKIPS